MTAPDLPTWTVAPDPNTGEPTLWHGDRSVIRRSDLRRVMAPSDADGLFDVLTRVLAPDEATLTQLDQRIDSYARVLDDPEQVRFCTEDVLSHLSGSGMSE